jgi:pyruvate ferredoxin oxidoreductase gamma subunit
MIEIRFHGRGGQGAVTCAELLAVTAISEGKFAQGFPSFGPERRGAPVQAFSRVDDDRIRVRSKIYEPDVAIVLDSTLLEVANPSEGLKADGVLIVNTERSPQEIREITGYAGRIVVVNATQIAMETIGRPITNTTMLGAMVKVTGVVSPSSLDGPMKARFGRLAARNLQAMSRAMDELRVEG